MIINFFIKSKDKDEIFLQELKDAHSDLKVCRNFFNNVNDSELVDYAIFKLEAAESKYSYLLKQAKERKIKYKGVYNI